MNATQIASVHIHHLRTLLQSNPGETAGLRQMIASLVDDAPFIHPNVTMRRHRPIVRPNVVERDVDFIETERIMEEARRARTVRHANYRRCVRKISSKYTEARLNNSSVMVCAICYEVPTLKNVCMTSCGHSFCSSCFDRWEEQCVLRANTTCPSCRTEKPPLTVYKPRKPRTKNARLDDAEIFNIDFD